RLPEGFLAVADAVCSFNPAYGQGMTVAAAEAMVLRDCLRQGRRNLPRRFFAAAAKVVDVPWDMAVGADLRHPAVVGPRSRRTRFLNGYVARLHAAAPRHPVVGRRFLSVANLMTPPPGLFAPGIVARVLRSGRRTTPQVVGPEPAARVGELVAR
ncbi:FAD-binding monooxygenase, partial [Micromonospora yasonensis]|nr:FAD-binding monooxygenase [Micromonospora yasonensis]